jgi:hypothetical protein
MEKSRLEVTHFATCGGPRRIFAGEFDLQNKKEVSMNRPKTTL